MARDKQTAPKDTAKLRQLTQGVAAVARTSIGELYHRLGKVGQKPTPEIELPPSVPIARVEIPEDPVERSKKIREEIWQLAKANAAYYEDRALKDDLRKPWFHYVKQASQYGEFVLLSPDLGEELLRYNPDNRNIKPHLVAAYRRDMDSDNWIPSHEGIGINLSGFMFDGQHRAQGVVEAKKAVPVWIVFNVLDEAKFVTDSGAKRNVNEKIQLVCDTTLANRTAGMVKAMMRGTSARVRFSETEIALFAVQYKNVIEWIGTHLPQARADVQAALGKAYLWHGGEKLEPFCDRLSGVRFSEDDDPAKTLYLYLQRLRQSKSNDPVSTYKKTLTAIAYTLKDQGISKLYETQEDIFQWIVDDQGNYLVPQKP